MVSYTCLFKAHENKASLSNGNTKAQKSIKENIKKDK